MTRNRQSPNPANRTREDIFRKANIVLYFLNIVIRFMAIILFYLIPQAGSKVNFKDVKNVIILYKCLKLNLKWKGLVRREVLKIQQLLSS